MPKVNLNRKEQPPMDWLWAVVLERRAVNKMTVKDLAKIAGVSYGTMRNYATKSPWDWPRPMRERVCKEFGISLAVSPKGLDLEVAK